MYGKINHDNDVWIIFPGGAGVANMAAHSVVHSMASNRKTSTVSDQKTGRDKHHSSTVGGGKSAIVASSAEGGTGSQVRMHGLFSFLHLFDLNILSQICCNYLKFFLTYDVFYRI